MGTGGGSDYGFDFRESPYSPKVVFIINDHEGEEGRLDWLRILLQNSYRYYMRIKVSLLMFIQLLFIHLNFLNAICPNYQRSLATF